MTKNKTYRQIVEEFIGRPLDKKEIIHHLNGIRSNNSINNLMIFPSQKAHASFHIKFNKFGLNKQIRNQIIFRWKDYKNTINDLTGFSKPIWEVGDLK